MASLIQGREQDVNHAITVLDNFTADLISQVNRLHTQGQGLRGFTSVTSTATVADPTVALNDPAADLDLAPIHGSFLIHVTQRSTGTRTTSTIQVDLDGIGPADTTLNSLAAALNGVANVTATVLLDGRLQIDSSGNDFEISFGPELQPGDQVPEALNAIDQSSNVLAALGINTFFAGDDAKNIAVNTVIQSDLAMINAAQDHRQGGNLNALALAGLRDRPLSILGNLSLTETWNHHIQDYAVRGGQAQQQLEADTIVRENLEAQQQTISGVNADEEAINLLLYQRAYQGSARFISVVDELIQTLLALV